MFKFGMYTAPKHPASTVGFILHAFHLTWLPIMVWTVPVRSSPSMLGLPKSVTTLICTNGFEHPIHNIWWQGREGKRETERQREREGGREGGKEREGERYCNQLPIRYSKVQLSFLVVCIVKRW